MARKTFPINMHPTHFRIMIVLSQKPITTNKTATLLKCSQSNIYEFMTKILLPEGYIIRNDNKKFILNTDRIRNEFLDLFYQKPIQEKLPDKNRFIKNKYFNFILESSLSLFYREVNNLPPSYTLTDFFFFLNQAIQSKFQDTTKTIEKIREEGNYLRSDYYVHIDWNEFLHGHDNDYSDFQTFEINTPRLINAIHAIDFEVAQNFQNFFFESTAQFRQGFYEWRVEEMKNRKDRMNAERKTERYKRLMKSAMTGSKPSPSSRKAKGSRP